MRLFSASSSGFQAGADGVEAEMQKVPQDLVRLDLLGRRPVMVGIRHVGLTAKFDCSGVAKGTPSPSA
jgi:hypothetical protein